MTRWLRELFCRHFYSFAPTCSSALKCRRCGKRLLRIDAFERGWLF